MYSCFTFFVNVLPYQNICTCRLSKKYLTCIPFEHKPFWQLSQSHDFAINHNCKYFCSRKTSASPGIVLYTSAFSKSFKRNKIGRIKE